MRLAASMSILVPLWLHLAERFTPTQAKRLFPIIGAGSIVGVIVGYAISDAIARRVGTTALLPASALVFLSGAIGTLYNTNVVLSPQGELLGKHRKLVPTWGERAVWTGGDGSTLSVFPTRFGPLGTLNCGENLNTLARFALLAQGERIHVANFPSAAVAGARHSANELYLHVAPHAYEGKLFTSCNVSLRRISTVI